MIEDVRDTMDDTQPIRLHDLQVTYGNGRLWLVCRCGHTHDFGIAQVTTEAIDRQIKTHVVEGTSV